MKLPMSVAHVTTVGLCKGRMGSYVLVIMSAMTLFPALSVEPRSWIVNEPAHHLCCGTLLEHVTWKAWTSSQQA